MVNKNFWGQTLSVDMSHCDMKKFSKSSLAKFCKELCHKIKMEREGSAIVKRFGEGNLLGNSAVQFIKTSSITIHADEVYNRIFIDVFSCKKFDKNVARDFCKNYFAAKKVKSRNYYRV
ncbi:MAG: S-adenosylmethionine decarboxylase [Candidatus Yonathbacteria bacterium CG_4_10_14_3_um_filter_47_65]|nr:MAG: S-adenosylmethionine decarboxylase [Candidatus Yonathbacteria bacterium CG23_combo_of_CG06-09_8_20_14_all_46_18]PIQ32081.1 MAG: S-adenosylmethionine decarboxylase [Candidatus Yonathbacteria bacterium CG17_big_fil_post_rev_8_21_14_2_50_46_19]PIX56382.1 MAG: S-adenosylmethionine decarboxylase [Candidatus Yonathbacteria bacterium CG_4_10_14_3_um_filter_47_65]PIY57377.1 MAG: S-adenosylmethionine decarboxylase [Candidatus Yonathbacteria bacterium CG_4_10_14_0_8_um_filter_47_645]PJB82287.1 MA